MASNKAAKDFSFNMPDSAEAFLQSAVAAILLGGKREDAKVVGVVVSSSSSSGMFAFSLVPPKYDEVGGSESARYLGPSPADVVPPPPGGLWSSALEYSSDQPWPIFPFY